MFEKYSTKFPEALLWDSCYQLIYILSSYHNELAANVQRVVLGPDSTPLLSRSDPPPALDFS